MAGHKSRKKHGRRKTRRRTPRLRLAFLCETHVGEEVRQAIGRIRGFSAASVRAYPPVDRTSDRGWVDVASRHGKVLLTRDTDCLDRVQYPPGSHQGVLVLRIRPARPTREIEVLRRFLSRYYKACRGNLVALHERHAHVIEADRQYSIILPGD